MANDEWYKAREIIEDILVKDLLGPVSDDEIIDEPPLSYYIIGKLYPQQSEIEVTETEEGIIDGIEEDVGESFDECISLTNTFNPSSMAVTFTLSANAAGLKAVVKGATYEPVNLAELIERQDYGNRYAWRRKPFEKIIDFSLESHDKAIMVENITENLEGRLYIHKAFTDGDVSATFAVVNTYMSLSNAVFDNEHSFFQIEVSLESQKEGEEIFVEKTMHAVSRHDPELMASDMLYRNVRNYAVGHGCSVGWVDGVAGASKIFTQFIPRHELLQMRSVARIDSPVFKMSFLAFSDRNVIVEELKKFIASYKSWIGRGKERMRSLDPKYIEAANKNMEKCDEAALRMAKCVELLEKNDDVMRAFQLANQAMLLQREQTLTKEGKTYDPDMVKWYPFQLGFILQEIPSIDDPADDYRNVVDLLWFPTGGGKTEAYLGLSAFTIFLRRLKYGDDGQGVTIIMRYTLRLLTIQQFERAATLICACEKMRREQGIAGGEIGIGLWVGGGLTPNTIKSAGENLRKVQDGEYISEGNPCQIVVCPWCGSPIDAHCYSIKGNSLIIACSNSECYFHKGLPLWLVDEDIYLKKPALVIGTVDKFARMTWEPRVGQIFGIGTRFRPPELIIQDELHLISGPLGTMTGLYEMAVRRFCERDGVGAKIIASTATIRKAEAQIAALYAMPVRQFPAQGLDIKDSYFAQEVDPANGPSRRYIGIMAPGISAMTMLIRVYASLLFATRYLKDCGFDDEVVDSFWTLVGYFNSLRELGGAVVQVLDSVQDRFKYLYTTKFKHLISQSFSKYTYDYYDELTSRKSNSEISEIIQKKLKLKFYEGRTYDFILASNMISVGVDIARLNIMAIEGQPKTTAEYIQASSRVGRETPGLAVVMYNTARSRDRSHYEQFLNYHSSLYRSVEVTSITPYSERARDRAFHAVYISLCRHLIDRLKDNDAASQFADNINGLDAIERYIADYVRKADPAEYDNVMKNIEEVKREWKFYLSDNLVYSANNSSATPLLRSADDEAGVFETPNSMRNVDKSSNVYILEDDKHGKITNW